MNGRLSPIIRNPKAYTLFPKEGGFVIRDSHQHLYKFYHYSEKENGPAGPLLFEGYRIMVQYAHTDQTKAKDVGVIFTDPKTGGLLVYKDMLGYIYEGFKDPDKNPRPSCGFAECTFRVFDPPFKVVIEIQSSYKRGGGWYTLDFPDPNDWSLTGYLNKNEPQRHFYLDTLTPLNEFSTEEGFILTHGKRFFNRYKMGRRY